MWQDVTEIFPGRLKAAIPAIRLAGQSDSAVMELPQPAEKPPIAWAAHCTARARQIADATDLS